MEIKSITIKNVRGIGEKTIELGMLPNKPSLLIAPNGSGKSSFAFAFQWLNRLKMKLNVDDAYNGDINNKPLLKIVTDEVANNEYIADENHNNISKRFGICVINNGLTASSPGVHNGILAGKARIIVPEITLLEGKCNDVELTDDFEQTYGLEDMPVGMFPTVSKYLSSNRFMSLIDFEQLKITQRPLSKLLAILDRIKSYDGRVADRYEKIVQDDKNDLESFPQIQYVIQIFRHLGNDEADVKLILKALRIVTLAYRETESFKARINYAHFKLDEESMRTLFASLKTTWKDIKPHRTGDKVTLKIGDAQRISNGERDILLLIGHLQEARSKLTKQDNILIIDEVFDYLDDANLIAAQHYINQFIAALKSEGKNIYPIILSHINPDYYRTFAFKRMKVYYFNPLQYPNASDNMLKLIRRRDDLEKTSNQEAGLVSKYMFHFHTDYSLDMSEIINMQDPNWGHILTFKEYCLRQVTEYLNGNRYDALGVCIALREMIEKYAFSMLQYDEHKRIFLEDKHGTENKLDYVESFSYILPETFSLLGLVYNDSLHFNNKNNIDLRQTLYSRLENNTIKGMIGEIKEMYNKLI